MKSTAGMSLSCALALSIFAPVVSPAATVATNVTFSRDVAPIIQKHCQNCHRPGEVAPMAFMTYKDVRPWAKSIREVTARRAMPPWFADPKHGEFSNDYSLSPKEIETLAAWADTGAKEGDSKDMPPTPAYVTGWNIGKPDVVLTMPAEFSVPERGTIAYQYITVPTNFAEDRYIQLAEIRPGDRRHVHHVIVSVKGQTGAAARGGDSDGRVVGWAPGEAPLILKPGQAKLVRKGAELVFQIHYTTNGETGKDLTSVGFIFSKDPVEKRVITAGAIARNLKIPPGDPNYESMGTFTFKDDSHIDSLHPHMHMRGKDFKYTLTYPDGTSRVLLSVPKYDFAWQLTYVLKEPVAAPAGSKLECVAHHDNSANNKFNPDPTKEVKWGEQTWDEMMIGYFDYTVDHQDLRRAGSQQQAGGE